MALAGPAIQVAAEPAKTTGQASGPTSVIHRGFEELRRGTLEDAGANTYVSATGRIQTIHRMDLNHDGELDLLFTQDHNDDYAPDALIYWNGPKGFKSLEPELPQLRSPYQLVKHAAQAHEGITWLPSLGGGRCQMADLNGDGYPEIILANAMHNYRQDVPAYIYWGSANGYKPSDRTLLPGYLVSGIAVGDLNGDGLPDIVLANRGAESEVEEAAEKMTHTLESYIYWGDPNGFDVTRRTAIPTIAAADVVIGDFNGDKHPDLGFVNDTRHERSIYIYWGDGTANFRESSRQVLPVADRGPAANRRDIEIRTLLAADVNGDGCSDLIAAGNHNCLIFSGSVRGLTAERTAELPADNCLGLEAADLNGDGRVDLIVANAGTNYEQPPASEVYWGSVEGYSPARRTDLPTLGAAAVKVADFNRDGFPDLLFGNKYSRRGFPSQIFWGGANGYASYRRKDLQGFGVEGVGVADLNHDGYPDVLLSNHISGGSGIPSAIYWGNEEHCYSSMALTLLVPGGEMMYSIADFDDDGFPDLAMCIKGRPFIWWGGPAGYDAANCTALPGHSLTEANRFFGLNVADLDRDGRLDLVCTVTGIAEAKQLARAIIYYGNGERFKVARSQELQLSGYFGTEALAIADLNKDGQLDLIFPMCNLDYSEIWWGNVSGYDAKRVTKIEANGAPTAIVADVDRDGWLDVIFTSGLAKRKPGQRVLGGIGVSDKTENSETLVYWGSPEGLKERTGLESFTGLDVAVADFNRDGHMDIALTNYKSDSTRELPAMIYWGDGTRNFGSPRRTLLDAASSSAIDALDLNRDGWPDLVISNHQKDFSHNGGTNIYWGSAKGFSPLNRTELPTIGVHLDATVGAGNIYTGKYEWAYTGTPIESPKGAMFARLRWKAEAALGTGVKFQVRCAVTREELDKVKWSGPKGADSFYLEGGAVLAGVRAEHRWLQYRAILFSPDGGNSPLLSEVEIGCTPTEATAGRP